MRPRILLIADVAGWAFDNIAQNIVANLGATHDFDICYMADFGARPAELLARHILPGRYDLIQFFWRDDLRGLLHPEHIHRAAAETGEAVDTLIDALCRPAIVATVYDHLHLDATALAERAGTLHFAHAYSVSSPILDGIYRAAPGLPAPDAMIPDGVRTDFFTPGTGERQGVAGPGGPLVVGWVGNSRWGDHSHADAKGLHTILKPALTALRAEGIAITDHFADIQQRKRNRDEMAAYYHEIDVLVCASLIEGTPNPVLEAMASGVAVVSTDVGIVREALGPEQAAMILPQRSPDAMAAALRAVATDRALLARLKAENLCRVPGWDWSLTTRGWPDLWALAQARSRDPRLARFRRAVLAEECRRLVPSPSPAADALPAPAALPGEALPAMPSEAPIPTWSPGWRVRVHQRAVDWLYARPRLAYTVNRLRGRKP